MSGELATLYQHPGVASSSYEEEVVAEERRLRIRRDAQSRLNGNVARGVGSIASLAAFLAQPDPPVRYRVDQLMTVGSRVVLSAQYKSGKSTLVGNLIRSLADGEPFLGRFAVEKPKGRIALLDTELDPSMLRRWLREQGIKDMDRVIVVPLRGEVGSFNILNDDLREQWGFELAQAEVDFAILDCLRPVLDAVGLSEHTEVGRFLEPFNDLLRDAGVAEAVVVHHAGHTGERSRGDSRLRDWPDQEWTMVRADEDPASPRFFKAFGRDVNLPESALTYEPTSRRLQLVGGSRKDSKGRQLVPAVVELLTERDGLSGRGIEESLAELGSRTEIRDAVRLAIDDGSVKTTEGPRRAIQHHVATGGLL